MGQRGYTRAMPITYRDLLAQTKREIQEISVEEVKQALESARPPRLLDVRETDEYAHGRLPGAVSIPRGFLESRVESVAKRDEPLVVYCAGGARSAFAAK